MNRLEELWDDKYSKYVEFNHYYFGFYIRQILDYHQEFKNKAVFVEAENRYPICQRVAKLIKNFEFPEDFEKVLNEMFTKVYEFDMALKKGFACFLCDFENARHIDMKTKSVFFNINVCDVIVTNTYQFTDYFNKYIYKYINTVSMLAHCINTHEILERREDEAKENEHEAIKEIHMMEKAEEDDDKRIKKQMEESRNLGSGRVLKADKGSLCFSISAYFTFITLFCLYKGLRL